MRTESESERLEAAVRSLTEAGVGKPDVVMVLGSGLAEFAEQLADSVEIQFCDVVNWPVTRVEGHGGNLVLGVAGGAKVACLSGRVHLYEGWHPSDVVRPVRSLRRLGAETFVVTNAAGGVNEDFRPGDLMMLTDHINLTGTSPLLGAHEEPLGPRFADQTAVYDPGLREILRRIDPDLREGVYAGLLGPTYETPAEVRMLRALGADAVGMSTVHEAMALNAMGARVAAVSLISNQAAGITESPLSHDEVMATGAAAAKRFSSLLLSLCEAIVS